MELYAGMDLHSRNTYVGILEKESNKRVYKKRLVNDLGVIRDQHPFFVVDLPLLQADLVFFARKSDGIMIY